MSLLVLVPTELELGILRQQISAVAGCEPAEFAALLCGFGPIVSGVRSLQCIDELRPTEVVLLGIAGSLAPECSVGTALVASQTACYGVGVGGGDSFQPAGQLGWQQWAQEPVIGDVLPLSVPQGVPANVVRGQLLTTPAASANTDEAGQKLRLFPQAIAEDMEAFSVAAACRMAGVPLTVIRGISNQAGQREHASWQVQPALRAVAEAFCGAFDF